MSEFDSDRAFQQVSSASCATAASVSGALDSLEHSTVPIPRDQEGPVFSEPWQAQVFAMTLQLHQQGLFEWQEWADTLSAKILNAQQAGDPDLGDTYYNHWLNALEQIVQDKKMGSADELRELKGLWDKAARATPHGQPIVIKEN